MSIIKGDCMVNQKVNIQKRWRLIVGLSLLFIFALLVQDVIREVIVFNRYLSIFEQEVYRDVKDDVKSLVISTDEDIQYDIALGQETIIQLAKDNLSGLASAAEAIALLHQTQPLVEIQQEIIDTAQLYNEADPNHGYYIYDVTGVEILNGETNMLTYTNLYEETDYLNREYMKTMIDGVQLSDAHDQVVNYFSFKDGVIEEYYLYAIEIIGTNLILATNVSVSSFIDSEIHSLIESLQYVNDNANNNVYVFTGDGEILLHQNEDAIGLRMTDTTRPIWSETLQLIVDFAQNSNEGFLEYQFYSNYSNGVLKDKVAYVKYIEEWDIILGASSDLDIYDDIFADYRAANYQAVVLIKIPAYIIIFTLSILLFVFIKNNVDLSQRILIEEERLYRKFADLTHEIIIITDKHGEIIFTNNQGHQNIFGQRENSDKVFFDQILVEEDGYYILYGIKEDLFVKFITEQVEFNNQPADLYIIMDVTEKIRTERKLEALSMIDELTGLGNRRMMVKDYNGTILPFVKTGGKAHIAMIDLDDFKPANDMYGHSYGDKVLKDISKIFVEESTKDVRFYRIGGDEFAILFQNLNESEIREFIDHLQQKVGLYPYEKQVRVGFSAGVAPILITEQFRRFSDFFDRADKLLYKSKNEGKNLINF